MGGLSFLEGVRAANNLADVAIGIMQPPEFQQASANLSDTQFVQLLYQDELGRAPDPRSQQGWLNDLTAGDTRANVAVVSATSPEARQHLAPLIEAAYHTG